MKTWPLWGLGLLGICPAALGQKNAATSSLAVAEAFRERAARLRHFRTEMLLARPELAPEEKTMGDFTREAVRFFVGFEGPPGWRLESVRLRVEGRPWRTIAIADASDGLGGMFWASLNMGRLPLGLKSVFAEARVVVESDHLPFASAPTTYRGTAFAPIRLDHQTQDGAFLLQATQTQPWRLHNIGVPP